jgi:hypothetical protein
MAVQLSRSTGRTMCIRFTIRLDSTQLGRNHEVFRIPENMANGVKLSCVSPMNAFVFHFRAKMMTSFYLAVFTTVRIKPETSCPNLKVSLALTK